MKIIIRADGGYSIGMGHVMRMLVLADKLRDFAEVTFACRKSEEFYAGVNHIEVRGYPVLKIDESKLMEELAETGGDCLITDSYAVDESYFDRTRSSFGITGYMDDLNRHRINTDFIINQNIYAEDLLYRAGEATKLYLGTKYTLLREEFKDLPRRQIGKKIENVLITLGGADAEDLSGTIALELSMAFPEILFHIIVGPSFTNKDSLMKLAGENIILHNNPNMSELMLKCDAAISACGSTVYELCACGTPIIGIVAADNQMMAANKMKSVGALKYAVKITDIIQYLKSMDFGVRRRMSAIGQGLADGFGSARLAEEIRRFI